MDIGNQFEFIFQSLFLYCTKYFDLETWCAVLWYGGQAQNTSHKELARLTL